LPVAGLPNSLHPDPIPAGLKDRWDLHWTEKDSRHDVIFAKRSLNFAIAVYYCSDHLVVQRQEHSSWMEVPMCTLAPARAEKAKMCSRGIVEDFSKQRIATMMLCRGCNKSTEMPFDLPWGILDELSWNPW